MDEFVLGAALRTTGKDPVAVKELEAIARLIFGDDVRISHQEIPGYYYCEDRGVYEVDGSGYSVCFPVVMHYCTLEDVGYEAAAVYLEESWNDSYQYHRADGGFLAEEDAWDYCLHEAPPYYVTLGEREKGDLYYISRSQNRSCAQA